MSRVRGIFNVAGHESGGRLHGSIQSARTGSSAPRRVGYRSPPETTNRIMRTQLKKAHSANNAINQRTVNSEQRKPRSVRLINTVDHLPNQKTDRRRSVQRGAPQLKSSWAWRRRARRRRCRHLTRQARSCWTRQTRDCRARQMRGQWARQTRAAGLGRRWAGQRGAAGLRRRGPLSPADAGPVDLADGGHWARQERGRWVEPFTGQKFGPKSNPPHYNKTKPEPKPFFAKNITQIQPVIH